MLRKFAIGGQEDRLRTVGVDVMGIKRLSAGSGYDYLTRQVVAQDTIERGHSSLASYYEQKGESPGRWLGSGIGPRPKGIEGLAVGDVVTQEQMHSLFGLGLHPLAEQRAEQRKNELLAQHEWDEQVLAEKLTDVQLLGKPFRFGDAPPSEFRIEVARACAEFNKDRGEITRAPLSVDDRARIRSQVGRELFTQAFGREPANERELAGFIAAQSRPASSTVAGFDLTFSPVKSVSALWALADPQFAAQIERAHQAAIEDALAYLEREAVFTRLGTNGVRQVETTGLVAVAFTHRDSRAGDPDLHTHVAVANKVQTRDGQWRSIDSRCLYRATVTASETYNTSLQQRLEQLGLRFEPRVRGDARKRPVWEIVGVEESLLAVWSKRRDSIQARVGQLAAGFQTEHGRPPTPVEMLQLSQQATLETRQGKSAPRSLAEQRAAWRAEAEATLGSPQIVDWMVNRVRDHDGPTKAVPDAAWVTQASADILATMERSRATWRATNVRAEAQRRVRGTTLPADQIEGLVDYLVAETLARSAPLPEPTQPAEAMPAMLRRSNGDSVYTVAGAQRFTSARVLAAEQNLVQLGGLDGGPTVSQGAVEAALEQQAAAGRPLNAGQAELVRGMARSGRRVQLAIAPAGSGKTTAMSALTDAWQRAGHQVFGLAPSAAAAAELGDKTGAHTDTLARLTHELDHAITGGLWSAIQPGDLVIIDEAGMADTLSLDQAVTALTRRGAAVRLIGDDQQLAAIGAGGVLRDLAHTHGALRLDELMRFRDPSEALASLALRDGRNEALGFYLDHDRIHVGERELMTTAVFAAWQADTRAGHDAIMLAPTRDDVADLNRRARAARLATSAQAPGRSITLADHNQASAGDVIITRANDRRLRVSATDWVKNGDRWTITEVRGDGSLTARHLHTHLNVTLPARYVTDAVELGWATTVHSAQGVSADTMHGLIDGAETRQLFYTMMTRGRHANHAYLAYTTSGEPDTSVWSETTYPETPSDVLDHILARDDAPVSATTEQRRAEAPATRLAHAVAIYTDGITVASEQLLGNEQLAAIAQHAEQLVPGITSNPAWDTLRAHLVRLAADGAPVHDLLTQAVQERELDSAHDTAAVLVWRLPGLPSGHGGPLPWLPAIPARLRDDPTWASYLQQCASQVGAAATALTGEVAPERPAWLPEVLPTPSPALLAELAVWRAANRVPDTDLRPTGPQQLAPTPARYQRRLENQLAIPTAAARREWVTSLTAHHPHIVRDPYLDQLVLQLAALSRAGIRADQLVADHTRLPLPDDHPAAALWWRIAGTLTPAQLDAARTPRTEWIHHLDPDRAHRLQTSPAWPKLHATINSALDRGVTLETLLASAPPASPGTDEAEQLLHRAHLLTTTADDPAPDPDPIDPHDRAAAMAREPRAGVSVEAATAAAESHWWEQEPDEPQSHPAPHTTRLDPQMQLYLAGLARPDGPHPLPATDADVRDWALRADQWNDQQVPRARLYAVNAAAHAYYQSRFPGSWAESYAAERFGTDLTAHGFEPGWAPDGNTRLVQHLRQAGFSDQELLAAGVALESQYRPGQLVDQFRNRFVLPLHDQHGIVGFVARRHPDSDKGPKYLNTKETAIFHKGAQFFGTPDGRPVADRPAVIVEGPMDAIAVTIATRGRYTGLAPMGTALTIDQANLLDQHHSSVILATDADIAGQVAAEKDFWRVAAYGHDPLLARFPDGADPASQLHDHGPDALHASLAAATPAARHLQLERLRNLPDQAALTEAAAITAARPPARWDDDMTFLADRLNRSRDEIEHRLAPLANAWSDDPRTQADQHLADATTTRKRLLANTPTTKYADLATRIDSRLTDDPTWPGLADTLQQIADDGLDVAYVTQLFADAGPLGPQPASTLRSRIVEGLNLDLPDTQFLLHEHESTTAPTRHDDEPHPRRRPDPLQPEW